MSGELDAGLSAAGAKTCNGFKHHVALDLDESGRMCECGGLHVSRSFSGIVVRVFSRELQQKVMALEEALRVQDDLIESQEDEIVELWGENKRLLAAAHGGEKPRKWRFF